MIGVPNDRPDNRVLASVSADDFTQLELRLRPARLELRRCLEAANKPITTVHFPLRGIVSVIVTSANGRRRTEVGLIGREGMTGFAIVLGTQTSPCSAFVQIEGDGLCIDAAEFSQLLRDSASLRLSLLRYVQVFLTQVTHSSLAAAVGTIEQRLARWLLMAQDRMGTHEIELTHDFLAVRLGVRRAGVTTALEGLQSKTLILRTRGQIAIVDRRGLEAAADGLYGAPEREMARLMLPS